jgi:hypothetical protein
MPARSSRQRDSAEPDPDANAETEPHGSAGFVEVKKWLRSMIRKVAGAHSKGIDLCVAAAVIAWLTLCVVLRRRIPRRRLDFVIGPLIDFNLIIHFIGFNLLLLTPSPNPAMLPE